MNFPMHKQKIQKHKQKKKNTINSNRKQKCSYQKEFHKHTIYQESQNMKRTRRDKPLSPEPYRK